LRGVAFWWIEIYEIETAIRNFRDCVVLNFDANNMPAVNASWLNTLKWVARA